MVQDKNAWMLKQITPERVNEAISAGAHTSKDIAEEMNVYRTRVQVLLKKMADAGEVDRNKIGGTFVYTLANAKPIERSEVKEGLKRCSRCNLELGHSAFSRNRAQKDGYHGYCKICDKSYNIERMVSALPEPDKPLTDKERRALAREAKRLAKGE